jgi:glycosyltransferase involved in cell wall biosynthesis
VSIPSSDGSPTSVWEALACATPVVCSDIRQVAERVGEGKGVLVTPINAGAVARALEAALVDPGRARDLGRAGRAWVETNVDRRTSLERLDGVYRELASPS